MEKAIDATIAAGPRGLLRDAGFRKKSRFFLRRIADVYHVIDFQASQFNEPDAASFTVNVGVTHPGLHEACCGQPFPKNPGTAVQAISVRLGDLIPSQQTDLWWDVSPETDVAELGRSIASLLRAYALPFLDNIRSSNDWLHNLAADSENLAVGLQGRVFEAILHCLTGDPDAADAVFRDLLAGKAPEEFKDSVR